MSILSQVRNGLFIIKQMFTKPLLCARHCTKPSISFVKLTPHIILKSAVIFSTLWVGNWGLGQLPHMLTVNRTGNGRERRQFDSGSRAQGPLDNSSSTVPTRNTDIPLYARFLPPFLPLTFFSLCTNPGTGAIPLTGHHHLYFSRE